MISSFGNSQALPCQEQVVGHRQAGNLNLLHCRKAHSLKPFAPGSVALTSYRFDLNRFPWITQKGNRWDTPMLGFFEHCSNQRVEYDAAIFIICPSSQTFPLGLFFSSHCCRSIFSPRASQCKLAPLSTPDPFSKQTRELADRVSATRPSCCFFVFLVMARHGSKV